MSLLVETLRSVDGVFEDLSPHLRRMSSSRLALWGLTNEIDLRRALNALESRTGVWKIRVLYDRVIRRIDAHEYTQPKIQTAAIVSDNEIDYSYKWNDRSRLDRLVLMAKNSGADTILIVKNGLITDFAYANAAFFDGSQWWTPAKPLLAGTRRKRLLDSNRIKIADIPPAYLGKFQMVSPINAMMDLGDVVIKVPNLCIDHL